MRDKRAQGEARVVNRSVHMMFLAEGNEALASKEVID